MGYHKAANKIGEFAEFVLVQRGGGMGCDDQTLEGHRPSQPENSPTRQHRTAATLFLGVLAPLPHEGG